MRLRYKIFSTKDMDVPDYKSFFRVGPWLGTCVVRTPWFVVMDRHRMVIGGITFKHKK